MKTKPTKASKVIPVQFDQTLSEAEYIMQVLFSKESPLADEKKNMALELMRKEVEAHSQMRQ